MGQNPRTSRYPQTNFHGHLLDGCSPKYRGGPSVLTHRRIVAKIPGPPDQVVMPTARGQMDGFTRAELILETRWTFCTRRRWCETKTGWCLGHLRKIWKSIGMITPNIWENKNLPNHQPENLLGREKKTCRKNRILQSVQRTNWPQYSQQQDGETKSLGLKVEIRISPTETGIDSIRVHVLGNFKCLCVLEPFLDLTSGCKANTNWNHHAAWLF